MADRAMWQAVADVVEEWGDATAVAEVDGVEAVAVGTVVDGVIVVDVVTSPAEVKCGADAG